MHKKNIFLYLHFLLLGFFASPEAKGQGCPAINQGSFIRNQEGCVQDLDVEFELRYGNLDTDAVITVNWGDGTVNQYQYSTTPAYFTSPTDFEATFIHNYPQGMGVCEYTIEGYAESSLCQSRSNTLQQQSVVVWDTDFLFEIDPQVFNVCQGTDANLTFVDGGEWNCFMTPVTERENLEDRTLRWSYNMPGTSLQGVEVDGTVYPTGVPFTDTEFVTSGQGNPSAGLYVPATRPDGTPHNVGDEFIVMLEIWNQCNPFGTAPPEITFARVVIVDPPNPTITAPAGPFCINEDIDFSVPGGAGYSYSWDFGDGNTSSSRTPTHNYTSDGTYTVNVTVTNSNITGSNCTVSSSTTVTVLQSPVADFSLTNTGSDACGSATVSINNASINSDGYNWTITPPPGGSVSYSSATTDNTSPNPADITFTGPGQYHVQLEATSTSVPGCPSTMEEYFYVYDTPVAGFTAPPVCYDDITGIGEVVFTDASSIPTVVNGDAIDTWEWDFDYDGVSFTTDQTLNGAFPAGFSYDFGAVGDYRVALRVSTANGCQSSVFEDSVFVNPLPQVGLAVMSATEGCAPFEVDFRNLKPDSLQSVAIDEFEFQVEDDAGNIYPSLTLDKNAVDFSYIFDNTTTANKRYYVTLVAKSQDACYRSIVPSIEIKVNPSVQTEYFTTGYSPTAANCAPITVDFTVDNTFDTNFPGADYTWTVIDPNGAYDTLVVGPSTDLNQTFTFRNHYEDSISGAGIAFKEYEVILEADSGDVCIRPYSEKIRVNPVPASTFTTEVIDETCDNVTVRMSAYQQGLVNYNWAVYENGVATAGLPNDLSEVEVTFNRPANGLADLVLDFELQTKNGFGCFSSVTSKTSEIVIPAKEAVTVVLDSLGALDANFSSCDPLTLEFQNNSTTTAAGVTYDLMVSPSSTFEPKAITSGSITDVFTYQFPGPGNYELKLRATTAQGCFYESATRLIKVNPNVDADFAIDKTAGCGPLDVTLTPLNPANVNQWTWTITRMSDTTQVYYGVNGTAASVLRTLPNPTNDTLTYQVELMVNSAAGCNDLVTKNITVYPEPQVGFELVGNPVCPPFDFQFVNTSNNPVGTTYTWEWGDGTETTVVSTDTIVADTLMHGYFNRNTFSGNDSYTVQLTADLPEGCSQTVTKTVTLRPDLLADFDLLHDVNGCAPLKVDVFNFSLGASNVEWSYREAGESTWTLFSSSPSTASYTFDNTSDTVKTFELRLLAIGPDDGSGYCTDEIVKTFNVEPKIEADFTVPASFICSEEEVFFENLIRKNGVRYTWNWGDGSPIDTTWAADLKASHSFVNNSPYGSRKYTITLTATDTASTCAFVISKDVTVQPEIRMDIQPSETEGCAPITIAFNNLSQGTSGQQWRVEGDSGVVVTSISNTYNYEYTFENPSSTDTVYYDLHYSGWNVAGCSKDTVIQISVFPEITADFTMTPHADDCSPRKFDLTVDKFNPRAVYTWDFGDGNTSSSPDTTYAFENSSVTNSWTYNVSLYVRDTLTECERVVTKQVTVLPTIEASIQADIDETCAPMQVSFRNNSALPVNHNWFYRLEGSSDTLELSHDFEPDFLFENKTPDSLRYEVIYIGENASGCTASDTLYITVQPEVIADFSWESDDVCSPREVRFINHDPISRSTLKYVWEWGDGSAPYETYNATDTVIHLYENPYSYGNKTYFATLTTIDTISGCSITSAPQAIFVPKQVGAEIVSSKNRTCGGESIEFENDARNASDAESFLWEISDSSTILLTDSTSALVSYELPKNYTANEKLYFIDLTVQSGNGCASYDRDTITVYPTPFLDFEVVGDTAMCSPYEFTFRNLSTAPDSVAYTWVWGDNTEEDTNEEIVYHTYESMAPEKSKRLVTLMASTPNGCTTSLTKEVVLKGVVDADFTLISSSRGCAPLTVEILDYSIGADSVIWEKRINGGSWSALFEEDFQRELELVNTGSQPITYEIREIAINVSGCIDEHTESVVVNPQVIADFTIMDYEAGDLLCSPYELTFRNNVVRSGVEYTWNFGDISPDVITYSDEQMVSHLYQVPPGSPPKTMTITLFAKDTLSGCYDSYTQQVQIEPMILTDIQPNVTEGCAPLAVSFENSSLGVSGNNHKWWYKRIGGVGLSDTSTVQNFNTVFENQTGGPQTYRVYYEGANASGCTEMDSVDIIVHPELNPVLEVLPEEMDLPETTVELYNYTPNKEHFTFSWHFGDSTFSQQINPATHSYETYGIYYVSMTVSNGYCEETVTKEVRIHAIPPEVSFDADTQEGCTPLTVQFKNTTKYAESNSYIWDFGDGSKSNAPEPEHTYYQPGVYSVTLSATNETGKRIEVVKEDLIVVNEPPVVLFDVRPDTVFLPGQLLYTANRTRDVGDSATYFWDFGDGTYSFEREPSHQYQQEGSYDITLAVTNKYGCSDTVTILRAVEVTNGGENRVPNAFTPNQSGPTGGSVDGSGNNDVFIPKLEGVASFRMLIFNRWGELLFESNSQQVGWDGYYKGRMAPQDVYVYQLFLIYTDGRRETKVGDVTLIR